MLADRSTLSSERHHPAADSDRYRYPQSNSRWSLGLLRKYTKKDCSPEEDRNATGLLTPNWDTWDSQSLNHQQENIKVLKLGLPGDTCVTDG